MGLLTLCFITSLIVYGPIAGQGQARRPGPCQPITANQTSLCTEFHRQITDVYGFNKFCNRSQASCRGGSYGPPSRIEFAWGNCYCDELCKRIGDCCVDYDEWYPASSASSQTTGFMESCGRKPSHEKSSIFGYIMVASCPPSWQNSSTAQKCVSTNYSADPSTALPVFDATENLTYANIYCAMCHGKKRHLHHWSLKILRNLRLDVSLQDIRLPNALWEAVPGEDMTTYKCLVTPKEAIAGPDTKEKRFCRAYANGIAIEQDSTNCQENFKNPHCALLSTESILVNNSVICHREGRLPSRMSSMIFIFSSKARASSLHFRSSAVRLEVSCDINEIYDPFKGKCLSVDSDFNHENTSEQELCRGPRIPSSEFLLLANHSVYVIPHQKVYNNDSFIEINKTLIVCSNFSRNYTITEEKPGKDPNLNQDQTLTFIVITYVGFSLSIISLVFLLLTYFLFGELRTYPGKAVMHLSCAMIAMQSVYFAADPDVVSSTACALLGALLHYSILAVFLWMGAIAHSTMKTFLKPKVNPSNPVVITEQKKAYISYSVVCWGLPFVAVGVCMALQWTSTGNVRYGSDVDKDGCQLSLPARIYAIAIPVSSLLLFNIVALIRTAFAIRQHGQGNREATSQRNLPVIVLKLTIVSGITWILGFALAFYSTPYLEYPYVVINSCQGVLICIIFVFRKPVIKLYKQRFMTKTHPEPPMYEPNNDTLGQNKPSQWKGPDRTTTTSDNTP